MKILYKLLTERGSCALYDLVNASEVIGRFNNIVNADPAFGNTDGVGFKNVPCLVVGEGLPPMWLELYVSSICILW